MSVFWSWPTVRPSCRMWMGLQVGRAPMTTRCAEGERGSGNCSGGLTTGRVASAMRRAPGFPYGSAVVEGGGRLWRSPGHLVHIGGKLWCAATGAFQLGEAAGVQRPGPEVLEQAAVTRGASRL